MTDRDKKIVFAIGLCPDNVPLFVLGIPRAAWVHMKDGKTHDFDFTKAGHNFRLMLFGGKDHEDCLKTIQAAASATGRLVTDERETDFTIPGAHRDGED